MRLSDAMNLGPTITKMDYQRWDTCLLGVSVQAASGIGKSNAFNKEAVARWPWIENEFCVPDWYLFPRLNEYRDPKVLRATTIISNAARWVNEGLVSLENVVDWIRSVEPAEAPQAETAQPETVLAHG